MPTNSNGEDAPKVSIHGIVNVLTSQGLRSAPFELQDEFGHLIQETPEMEYMEKYADAAMNSNPNIVSMAFMRTELLASFTREEESAPVPPPPAPVETAFSREVCSQEGCNNLTDGIYVRDGEYKIPMCDECWERTHPGETPVRVKRG